MKYLLLCVSDSEKDKRVRACFDFVRVRLRVFFRGVGSLTNENEKTDRKKCQKCTQKNFYWKI